MKAGWRLPAACLPAGRAGRKKHNTGTFKKKHYKYLKT
jgi:hypothetical protein